MQHENNNKKRMLVVHTSFKMCGGVETSLLTLLNLFPEDEYQIDLALLYHLQDEAKLLDAVPGHVNILPELVQLQKWTPALVRKLKRLGMERATEVKTFIHKRNKNKDFRNLPVDYRHAENWKHLKDICPLYEGYDIAVAAVGGLPLKVVATRTPGAKKITYIRTDFIPMIEKGIYENEFVKSEYIYYKEMDGIICLSEQNAKALCSLFPDLQNKVKVLPHIRNKDYIMTKANEYFPDEYKDSSFNILTVARIDKQKGIDLIIAGACALKAFGMSFRWFIIGHDPEWNYSQNCHAMVESFGLEDNVIFLKERANVFPFYLHCDLYVQTSLFEGRCNTIEEAMIIGCPIVSTNFSSVTDQISHEKNGIICSMEPDNIAKAIYDLYCNGDKRRQIAAGNEGYLGNTDVEEYLAYYAGMSDR